LEGAMVGDSSTDGSRILVAWTQKASHRNRGTGLRVRVVRFSGTFSGLANWYKIYAKLLSLIDLDYTPLSMLHARVLVQFCMRFA
jgi:hypothetical protein